MVDKNVLPQELLMFFKDKLQYEFIMEYVKAVNSAREIVASRESSRNSVFSIPEMFPYGLEGIMSLCAIKVNRIIGDLKVGEFDHGKSEAEDLMNYSSFYVAYHNLIERLQNVPSVNTPSPRIENVQPGKENTSFAVSSTGQLGLPTVLPDRGARR